MSYKAGIRPDGKDEVEIRAEHRHIVIEEHYEGGVLVELNYDKAKLYRHDPTGAEALSDAWPTVDGLVLYRKEDGGEWGEIFSGTVTKVDVDNHEAAITAHMVAIEPPNPLTLAVQEDTDDPTRFTVLVTADNDGEGTVALSFGDGTTGSSPGDGASGNQHVYASPGTYTITATSNSDLNRTATQTVTVPFTS